MTKRTITLRASVALRAGYAVPLLSPASLERHGFSGSPDNPEQLTAFVEAHPILDIGFGIDVEVDISNTNSK